MRPRAMIYWRKCGDCLVTVTNMASQNDRDRLNAALRSLRDIIQRHEKIGLAKSSNGRS